MLKKRNAQELSITTIIISVIGLIVLVVIIAMLTGKLGSFSKGVGEGESTGQNLINKIKGTFGGGGGSSGGSSGSSGSNPLQPIGTCTEECLQEYDLGASTFTYGGEACAENYRELSGGFRESDNDKRCCCI